MKLRFYFRIDTEKRLWTVKKIVICQEVQYTAARLEYLQAKRRTLPRILTITIRRSIALISRAKSAAFIIRMFDDCKEPTTLMGGDVYAEIQDECFCVTLVVKQT